MGDMTLTAAVEPVAAPSPEVPSALLVPADTVLTGRHVRLRPLHVDDAAITMTWRSGARASLLNRGAASVAEQARWIASRPDGEFNMIIELLDGTPVGMISLIDVDFHHRRAEPGRLLVGEPELATGVPVAIEALGLIYELAFERLGLERIHGIVAEDNRPVVKLQTYLGLSVEGRLRKHLNINGRLQDAICMGLLADEYRATTRSRISTLVAMSTARNP
jgi:RimJ/RimL family protein N-acetyltransferase